MLVSSRGHGACGALPFPPRSAASRVLRGHLHLIGQISISLHTDTLPLRLGKQQEGRIKVDKRPPILPIAHRPIDFKQGGSKLSACSSSALSFAICRPARMLNSSPLLSSLSYFFEIISKAGSRKVRVIPGNPEGKG